MLVKIEQWQNDGRFFRYRGQQIFYRSEGSGPVLFLIHGYPTSSWDWYKLWPQLTENFCCIALDMLGFGFSDKPNKTYSLMEQADICVALLRYLNISHCHVLAHDYGDSVAQELLARHNEDSLAVSLDNMIFLNGGLFPETHYPVLMQKLLLSRFGGVLVRCLSKETLAKNLTKVFGPKTPPSEAEIESFWCLMRHNNGNHVMHRLIHYMTDRRTHRERWVGALQQASIPLLVIDGMLDPVSGAHMVDRYRALVEGPNVVELPNVGHYPQIEAPAEVLSALLMFLDTTTAKA